MGKYYKTNTVPIVDYTINYPFRDLMQAELYKQQRSDKTMDLLDTKRKELLDMTAIPGQTITNPDGTTYYQKSGDEMLLDAKREEYNTFVESMRGKDLAKNYGAIRQGINDLYDPALADIQKSREAYDAEQTSIEKMKAEGTWDDYGWANPAGWDSKGSGIYKGTASPFFDYRPSAEKIFDKAVENTYMDRTTGLLREELSEDKLRELAMRGAPSFMANPKNHRAIDKHLATMDPVERANWIKSYGQEGARKRAAQEMLFDVGMERWSSQIKVPKKSQKASTGTTASTGQQAAQSSFVKFPTTELAEDLSHDGTATVSLADGGVDVLLNAPKSKRKNGYYDVSGNSFNPKDNPIIVGNVKQNGSQIYFDYDPETGISLPIELGQKSTFLGRPVTEDDVFYQQNQRQLQHEFEADMVTDDVSMEEYQKTAAKIKALKDEYKDITSIAGSSDLVDFTDEDQDTQESVMRAITMAEGSPSAHQYQSLTGSPKTPRIYKMPDGTIKAFIGKKETTFHGADVTKPDLEAEQSFLTDVLGKEVNIGTSSIPIMNLLADDPAEINAALNEQGISIITPNAAKQILRAQGNWASDVELKGGNLKQQIDELEASNLVAANEYKRKLKDYRGRGLLDPDSDESKASSLAFKEYLKEQGGEALTAKQLASLNGNDIFQGMSFDFKPHSMDNVVTIDGKMYMSGTARLTDTEVANLLGGTGKEFEDGRVIEGTSGHPDAFWNFFGGAPGTTNIEQALLGAGLANRSKWINDKGEEETGLEISTFMPIDFNKGIRNAYNNETRQYTGSAYAENQAANEQALLNIQRQNKQDARLRREKGYNNSVSQSQERNLTKMAQNILDQGVMDKTQLRQLAERDIDSYLKLETDKELMQEKVQSWKDYLTKADDQDWGGSSFVRKELEPHLKVLEDFISFPRDLDEGGKNSVRKAIAELSKAEPFLMNPMGVLTASAQGSTPGQNNILDSLQKRNYTEYKNLVMERDLYDEVVPTMVENKASDGTLLPTQALEDYKSIGKQEAEMANLTKITPTNTNIAINSSQTYIPYVAPATQNSPGFMSTLESIGKLGLNGLEISGALTLAPYERDLGITNQSGAMTSGMGVDFSIDTPQKRKAAEALKIAIAESEWGGSYGGKSIKIPQGYHLVANELGNPPRLQVTLEKD